MRIALATFLRSALRIVHFGLLVASVAVIAVPAWRTGWPRHVFFGLLYTSWTVDLWGSWRRGHLRKTLPEIHALARSGEPLLSRDPLERISSAAGMIALLFVIFAA